MLRHFCTDQSSPISTRPAICTCTIHSLFYFKMPQFGASQNGGPLQVGSKGSHKDDQPFLGSQFGETRGTMKGISTGSVAKTFCPSLATKLVHIYIYMYICIYIFGGILLLPVGFGCLLMRAFMEVLENEIKKRIFRKSFGYGVFRVRVLTENSRESCWEHQQFAHFVVCEDLEFNNHHHESHQISSFTLDFNADDAGDAGSASPASPASWAWKRHSFPPGLLPESTDFVSPSSMSGCSSPKRTACASLRHQTHA